MGRQAVVLRKRFGADWSCSLYTVGTCGKVDVSTGTTDHELRTQRLKAITAQQIRGKWVCHLESIPTYAV